MANGNTTEWLSQLQTLLTQLQVSSAGIEQKVDAIKQGMEKLETSLIKMQTATQNQETRLVLLEEKCKRFRSEIPDTLNEDLALVKSQLKNYHRFVWLIFSAVVVTIIKITIG
jgi:chromosome segregation ATPase